MTMLAGDKVTNVRGWSKQRVRVLVGTGTRRERVLRHTYATLRNGRTRRESGAGFVQHVGTRFVHIKSTRGPGPRVGIFVRGSCDLPSMFLAAPLIRANLSGTCCIYRQGSGVADARPDLLLQTLSPPSKETVRDLLASSNVLGELWLKPSFPRIRLAADYFEPTLFDPTFEVPGIHRFGPFPKTVVVLSVAPALTRTVYQHRTLGFLVDPGGFWLNEAIDSVLEDLSTAKWFKENFRSLGRMSPETFHQIFGEVVRQLRNRTGAHVVVYNTLVVDPGTLTHNYQFIRNSPVARRRDFDLALRDLSRELDFHIVDVDKILKSAGVREQVDFAHFPAERMLPIAAEAYRILKELEVVR